MSTNALPTKVVNQAFYDQITSNDQGMVKNAQEAATDFTRMKMREDGFLRKILPPIPITNDELHPAVDTDKPMRIEEKEPESPAAISMPFATLPTNWYIKGRKYRIVFQRIETPRFTKDLDELRTYTMDIRQVLSDNAIKDMLAEEDGNFIATVDAIVGAEGSTVALTGVVQNRVLDSGVTRQGVAESFKTLPSTPAHLECSTVLVNNVTVYEIAKWNRLEIGGDLAQDILLKGWSEQTLMGKRLIVTIKRTIVDDDVMYQFADPKFTGKFYILEDATLAIEKKFYLLEYFAYESIGAAIANAAAVARVRFAGASVSE